MNLKAIVGVVFLSTVFVSVVNAGSQPNNQLNAAIYVAFQDQTFFTNAEIERAREIIYLQAKQGDSMAEKIAARLDEQTAPRVLLAKNAD